MNASPSAAVCPATSTKPLALFLLMVTLSGLAGLGYQMVWTQLLAVALGHEIVAVLAVVSAFFCGLAAGAFVLGQRIRQASQPQRWYLLLEVVIGVWALILIVLIPWFNQWLPSLIGPSPSALFHWAAAFSATLLLLFPSTFAMGATLPAMERMLVQHWGYDNRVPLLYSMNTLGAVLGTLLATFLLIPSLGLNLIQSVLVGVNWVCVGLVLLLFWGAKTTDESTGLSYTPAPGLLALGFTTGLLGIGYEVLVVRVLSQILENTVYSFAALLAVYLLGVSLGAWIYQRNISRHVNKPWTLVLHNWLRVTAVCCLLGMLALWLANESYLWLLNNMARGWLNAILMEIAVASLVFLLPTMAMGALFSHLAVKAVDTSGLGPLLGWNTLGAALAPLLFGVLLLPLMGAKNALLLVILGYLALGLNLQEKSRLTTAVLALLVVAVMLAPLKLRFIHVPPNTEVVAYQEGVMAAVAVVEDANGDRHLKVNNHFTMGGTASRLSDHRQSHIPLLLHGSAESALYLGLGTGITFEASAYYPDLAVTAVELIPEAVAVMPMFGVEPETGGWSQAPTVLAADARRYVLSSEQSFDVIIAEIFHPSRDGAGSLYTVEHFEAVKERLNEDGLFCQWLPLFQLDMTTLRTIVRTFIQVFPHAQMHLGHSSLEQPILCLAGYQQPPQIEPNWLLQRITHPPLQQELVKARLNSDFALFGGYLGGSTELQSFAGEGDINADNKPVVTYRAPGFVYQQQAHPSARLLEVLSAMDADPKQWVKPTNSEFERRLQRYLNARNVFIETGVAARNAQSVVEMLAISRQPLLAIVRDTEDFTPAYRTLLFGAQALAQSDPENAFVLLTELANASPQQPEARRLRQQLFGR